MKKIAIILLLISGINSYVLADASGLYVGGGLGYGMQQLSGYGNDAVTYGTPAIRAFVGYQFASWVDAEFGYTYISQAENWNNLGAPSTTIYDLAFAPGFTIPLTPVTIYARLGIDAVSANFNSSWYNQVISSMNANFEWGAGVKVDIPGSNTFIRAEYINFGAVTNNNNAGVTTSPSALMINAGYVF